MPLLLNTSRDDDPTTALGSLFQCLTILYGEEIFFLISNLNSPGTAWGYDELEGISERGSLKSWIPLFLLQMTGLSKLNASLRALTVMEKLPWSKTGWYMNCSARALPGETQGPKDWVKVKFGFESFKVSYTIKWMSCWLDILLLPLKKAALNSATHPTTLTPSLLCLEFK